MEMILTDGTDQRFIHLCHELDDYLDETAGGKIQRQQYNQYNTLEQIHNVVLVMHKGVAAACGSFREYESGVAEVKRVFTREEYRHCGFGRICMEKIEEQARQQGYYKLILETGSILTYACQLFESMGYQVIPNYRPYKEMKDSVCMGKRI